LGKGGRFEKCKKVAVEFEERMNAEDEKQERIEVEEERDFKRGKLPGKYTTKMLYR